MAEQGPALCLRVQQTVIRSLFFLCYFCYCCWQQFFCYVVVNIITTIIIAIIIIRTVVNVVVFRSLGSLVFGSWSPKQCREWAPCCGMGLRSNQMFIISLNLYIHIILWPSVLFILYDILIWEIIIYGHLHISAGFFVFFPLQIIFCYNFNLF